MMSWLSSWQAIGALSLGLLGFGYALAFRVWRAPVAGADLIFALSLALAAASLTAPAAFQFPTRALVERSPLPVALEQADARVAALATLPGELIEAALDRFGYAGAEPALDSPPEETPIQSGSFVAGIRPSIEGLISSVLRGFGLCLGALGMLTALALRVATMAVRKAQMLSLRLAALERHLLDPPPRRDGEMGEAR